MEHATAPVVGTPRHCCFPVQAGAIVPRCKHNVNMGMCCARLQGSRVSRRSLYPIRLVSAARTTHLVQGVFLVLVLVLIFGSGSWGTPLFLRS